MCPVPTGQGSRPLLSCGGQGLCPKACCVLCVSLLKFKLCWVTWRHGYLPFLWQSSSVKGKPRSRGGITLGAVPCQWSARPCPHVQRTWVDISCVCWLESLEGESQRWGEKPKDPPTEELLRGGPWLQQPKRPTCSYHHCGLWTSGGQLCRFSKLHKAEKGRAGGIHRKWKRPRKRVVNWGHGEQRGSSHLSGEASWDGGTGLCESCWITIFILALRAFRLFYGPFETFRLIQAWQIHQGMLVMYRCISTYSLPKFPGFLLNY